MNELVSLEVELAVVVGERTDVTVRMEDDQLCLAMGEQQLRIEFHDPEDVPAPACFRWREYTAERMREVTDGSRDDALAAVRRWLET